MLRQFEMMGVYTSNSSDAVLRARDKLRSLQMLAREGIDLPRTVFGDYPDDTVDLLQCWATRRTIKLNEGTQGQGVLPAEKRSSSQGTIGGVSCSANRRPGIIGEAGGGDLRCFVVGNEVAAAMHRQGSGVEISANLHRGGKASKVELSEEERSVALSAGGNPESGHRRRGLAEAWRRGPLEVLEVNASPASKASSRRPGWIWPAASLPESRPASLAHQWPDRGTDASRVDRPCKNWWLTEE
ncbi:30S ribosomal protein S6--L-glutamate ligase [Dokdonella sp.]|uniref:30S ribosomal protein S6--L-glutamate ligase n=1 Tax=Dokdonella sp. TaxID=2291710 RepID=UPI0035298CBF